MTKATDTLAASAGDIGLTDQDVYEAMKSIPGYLDITPGDFRELYCYAYRQAIERISKSVLAGDVMSQEVVTVDSDAPLSEVAELMSQRDISGLPVTDARGKIVGVISEKDFLAKMTKTGPKNFMGVIASCLAAKGCIALPIRAAKAGDIMTSPAVTVAENSPIAEVAGLMAQRAVNRVPVTDPEGRLLGIITRNDLIRASSKNATCSALISPK